MDQVRNFAQTNRSSIVNIIYIVAAVVLVYYLVMFYFNSGDQIDVTVLGKKLATTSEGAYNKAIQVVAKDSTKGRASNEYTISAWIYVNSYNPDSKVQGILGFFDDPTTTATASIQSSLFIGLHPTLPKMIIRAGKFLDQANTASASATSYGANDLYNTYSVTTASAPGAAKTYAFTADSSSMTVSTTETIDSNTPCDVMDIDLQRWMNVTVSVNGRIMDVYLDGKLARSCIMPNAQYFSNNGAQLIMLCPSAKTFSGYISGVMYSNYALTPDVIYGRYQAGPYFSSSFLDYLMEKLGIRISYTGTTDETSGSWALTDLLPFKGS
jgi:hypothetical protein